MRKTAAWGLLMASMAVLFLGTGEAQAQTMDFESLPSPGSECNPISELEENGLVLDSSAPPQCLFDSALDNDINGNGGVFLGWCGGCVFPHFFSLARLDGEAFDFLSIDFASLNPDPSEGEGGGPLSDLLIRGFRADNSVVETTITPLSNDWQSYAVTGITGVVRVEWYLAEDLGPNAAADNFVTRASDTDGQPGGGSSIAIPVPADRGMLLLMTLMLALGMAALRKNTDV